MPKQYLCIENIPCHHASNSVLNFCKRHVYHIRSFVKFYPFPKQFIGYLNKDATENDLNIPTCYERILLTLKMVILTSLNRPLQYFSACGMWNISSRNGNGCTSYTILNMHNVAMANNIYTAAGKASEVFKKAGGLPFMAGDNYIITKNLYH
jgi:hypothetical protein